MTSTAPQPAAVAFAMTYPDHEGNVWVRLGTTYDRVAERLAAGGIGAVMCFPQLTDRPAFATPHVERAAVNLCDFSPANREMIEQFIKARGVRAIVFTDMSPGLVPLGWLHGLGVKSINASQFSWPDERPGAVRKMADWVRGRLGLRHHDVYLANSQHQYEFLTRVRMIPPSRVRLAVNGIDETQFSPLPAGTDRGEHAAKLGLRRTAHYATIVCQSRPEKRVDFLIDVAGEVFHARRDLSDTLTFVYAGDGGERAKWQAKATAAGLGERFAFLGQVRDTTAVHQLATVMLHAASRESFGFALVEAMACGAPVIATAAGGPREIVVDGQTGYLLGAEDRAGFVQRVIELVTNPAKRGAMGAAARRRVLEHFTLERQARETADAIREQLER